MDADEEVGFEAQSQPQRNKCFWVTVLILVFVGAIAGGTTFGAALVDIIDDDIKPKTWVLMGAGITLSLAAIALDMGSRKYLSGRWCSRKGIWQLW